jgi:drug/metabolite transporter (DMT)-like permease
MNSPKVDHEHTAPLLEEERNSQEDIELAELNDQDPLHRTSTELSHEPPIPSVPKDTRSYLAIAAALMITVFCFMVNTESTAYFEDVLGWKKPFCTMYITHSSLCLPWVGHVMWSRWKERHMPYKAWVKEYNNQLRELVATIDAYASSGSKFIIKRKGNVAGPLDFLATSMGLVTVVLTVSGCSWFLSLVLTTPADLTAIYNCSTFFAAAFSVPLLKERLSWVAISAVAMAIIGTFIIAYGDTTAEHEESAIGSSRLIGNLIAAIGAVAFGLYEVLFKKFACSSRPMAPSASLPLTFAASALTGIYTFATLWVGLVILHFTGVEEFVWPSAKVGLWIFIAVISGSSKFRLLKLLEFG